MVYKNKSNPKRKFLLERKGEPNIIGKRKLTKDELDRHMNPAMYVEGFE